ncbi:MAG: polyhydroxybutyrate depolymerase [Chloroflexi bacterium]|nr:polyhydroxybutyrate depolymerase [Chloroflexota bacterium]
MKALRILFLVAIIGLLGLACRASIRVGAGDEEIRQTFNGRHRRVLLHFPPAYDGNELLPLLIVLHGGGGDGAQVRRLTAMDTDADDFGFVVAYPDGSSRMEERIYTWNSGHCCGFALAQEVNDVGFLATLIDQLLADYAIDSDRVYLAGISNGGMLAYRAGAELSERVAGIAPIAGTIGGQIEAGEPVIVPDSPKQVVAVLAFHGQLDQHVLYAGGHGPKTTAERVDLSVVDSVNFWVGANECSGTYEEEISQSGNIIVRRYSDCAAGGDVALVTIVDGGHAWPGASKGLFSDEPTQEISANRMLLEFFERLP